MRLRTLSQQRKVCVIEILSFNISITKTLPGGVKIGSGPGKVSPDALSSPGRFTHAGGVSAGGAATPGDKVYDDFTDSHTGMTDTMEKTTITDSSSSVSHSKMEHIVDALFDIVESSEWFDLYEELEGLLQGSQISDHARNQVDAVRSLLEKIKNILTRD